MQRFRECELIHGRWCMMATLGAIVAELNTGVSWVRPLSPCVSSDPPRFPQALHGSMRPGDPPEGNHRWRLRDVRRTPGDRWG